MKTFEIVIIAIIVAVLALFLLKYSKLDLTSYLPPTLLASNCGYNPRNGYYNPCPPNGICPNTGSQCNPLPTSCQEPRGGSTPCPPNGICPSGNKCNPDSA